MIEVIELDNFKKKFSYNINNKEVGYIIIEEVIDFVNIVDVLTIDEYRRQGIATKLFNYIISLNKDKDVKYMLEVREDNEPAINLYKKLGFNSIHIRKKYYKNCDAIIMEMKK